MAWINLLDVIYPIGSLYFSNKATSPASIVGGSWTKIEEAVIRSGNTVGYMGEDEHAITIDEMPSHRHNIDIYLHDYNGTNQSCNRTQWTDKKDAAGKALTNVKGGGQAMSLVQHSYNCYIWYRTA
jgi:hypothetical protein